MHFYFQNARLRALHTWLYGTGRVLLNKDGEVLSREYHSSNFECKWQLKNEELHVGTPQEDNHISIFCSLNDWASHITDILGDHRFDLIPLIEEPIREEEINKDGNKIENDVFEYKLLARHYARFFLVVSELIVDFDDMAKLIDKSLTNKIFENSNLMSYLGLRGYINNVFKHKTKNIHKCNHHIPIVFEDGNIYNDLIETNHANYYIKVGCTHEYELKNTEYILVLPRLIEVVKLLIYCYEKIDELLTADKIKSIASTYGSKYPATNYQTKKR